MSIRLVRQSSEIPNISNRDDVKLARYAYGNYSGYVKGVGSEIGYSSSSVFTITSGRIVLQGWEVDIDEEGVPLVLENEAYNTIYLELNLLSETAKIISVYDSLSYPIISSGDDLSRYPNGTARLTLYTVYWREESSPDVTKWIHPIPYSLDQYQEFDEFQVSVEARFSELPQYISQKTYRIFGVGSRVVSGTVYTGYFSLFYSELTSADPPYDYTYSDFIGKGKILCSGEVSPGSTSSAGAGVSYPATSFEATFDSDTENVIFNIESLQPSGGNVDLMTFSYDYAVTLDQLKVVGQAHSVQTIKK